MEKDERKLRGHLMTLRKKYMNPDLLVSLRYDEEYYTTAHKQLVKLLRQKWPWMKES